MPNHISTDWLRTMWHSQQEGIDDEKTACVWFFFPWSPFFFLFLFLFFSHGGKGKRKKGKGTTDPECCFALTLSSYESEKQFSGAFSIPIPTYCMLDLLYSKVCKGNCADYLSNQKGKWNWLIPEYKIRLSGCLGFFQCSSNSFLRLPLLGLHFSPLF